MKSIYFFFKKVIDIKRICELIFIYQQSYYMCKKNENKIVNWCFKNLK